MIDSGNFAGGGQGGTEHGGQNDSDMIARARAQAQGNQPDSDFEPNNNRGSGGMSRRVFLAGAGVVGVGLLGLGAWWFLGPKEEKKEEPTEEQQQEAPKKELPTKKVLEGDSVIVGEDIERGAWFVQWFDINSDLWLEVKRDNDTYELARPQLEENVQYWANQSLVVVLEEGDIVRANATLEQTSENELPKSTLEKIGTIRSGMLLTDIDLIPGTWEVTPKDVLDEIDPKTGLAVEGDLTWQGRITGLCANWAKENKKTMEELQAACQGVIVLDYEEAKELLGPTCAASIPFSAEEALIASGAEIPSSEKTEEKKDENKDQNTTSTNINTGEAAAAGSGESPAPETPAAAVNFAAIENAWMDEGETPKEENKENTSGDAIPVTTKKEEETKNENTDKKTEEKKDETSSEEKKDEKSSEQKKEEVPNTLENRQEGKHEAAAAILAKYFDGTYTSGFTKVNTNPTEVQIPKGSLVLPILVDMILVKEATDSDESSSNNKSSSRNDSSSTSDSS